MVAIEYNEGYDLVWFADMQYEACLILDEQRDYIEGFLDGCYKLLALNYDIPTRIWGHCAGHVANVPKDVAYTLKPLLEELLQGLVTARYQNLEAANKRDE
jgi:hypothetical protein